VAGCIYMKAVKNDTFLTAFRILVI